jgi:hypothetical protein
MISLQNSVWIVPVLSSNEKSGKTSATMRTTLWRHGMNAQKP